jgi:hypothetical protein
VVGVTLVAVVPRGIGDGAIDMARLTWRD